MPEKLEKLQTLAVTYGLRIVGAIALLFVAWLIAGWMRRLVTKSLGKARIDETLSKFLGNLVRYLVIVMAVLSCLSAFGVETTSFAAVLGAAGLAVGLALQGSLANFASGVMLLVFRPFRVGEVITAAGHTGKVDEVELFTTRLITPDNRILILPNAAVFGGPIENITTNATRRVDVTIGVSYSANIPKTRALLEAVVASCEPKLSDPAPQVYLADLGASSVDWAIRVWAKTDDYWTLRERLVEKAKEELDAAGIGIPFPQMDIHLDEPVVKALEARKNLAA
ncbi:MAG: mechanosensitive ion channel [Deltaproteobacteria bacterium]|nr:mechanosensitive ion channel [Deltaproteobacteria bacterium]